jgi:hypothetical protein
LRVFAATVLTIAFVLHWNIGVTMPHARAGSLALHQACVIEAIGLLAPVSGCASAQRLDFARCTSSGERCVLQRRPRAEQLANAVGTD